jgi:nicotinamidase/pyrazinamidase
MIRLNPYNFTSERGYDMTKKSALIIVDLQNDFCEGGALGALGSENIIPVINRLQSQFDLVIATQDWHPADHTSFASSHPESRVGDVIKLGLLDQILWPDHCVQGTKGAEFHAGLDTRRIDKIFHKGVDRDIDSYSAFYDNAHLRATGLAAYLREAGVTDVYLVGLVTEYCVKYSALDAKHEGFNVHVILDGCRGVALNAGDVDAAINEMKQNGIIIIDSYPSH